MTRFPNEQLLNPCDSDFSFVTIIELHLLEQRHISSTARDTRPVYFYKTPIVHTEWFHIHPWHFVRQRWTDGFSMTTVTYLHLFITSSAPRTYRFLRVQRGDLCNVLIDFLKKKFQCTVHICKRNNISFTRHMAKKASGSYQQWTASFALQEACNSRLWFIDWLSKWKISITISGLVPCLSNHVCFLDQKSQSQCLAARNSRRSCLSIAALKNLLFSGHQLMTLWTESGNFDSICDASRWQTWSDMFSNSDV